MKISKVQIANWRSINDIQITFQDLMIFIGQNNHGKSNILNALLFFFGEIRHQSLDFKNIANDLFVEIEFNSLDETDKTTFKKYLTNSGNIVIRKTGYVDGNFVYQGYTHSPVDAFLKEENIPLFTKREIVAASPIYEFVEKSGRITKQEIQEAQEKYIEKYKSGIEFSFKLESTNFLGLKSVAKGIFGDIFFVPAVKDAHDDFSTKDSSPFGKIYSLIIESITAENADWKDAKTTIDTLFTKLNKYTIDGLENTERPEELKDLERSLSLELDIWGTSIDVEVTPPKIDNLFQSSTQVWIDDGVRTDIRRKGHGLQRALIFALIKVISAKDQKVRNSEALAPVARVASNSRYFIFEEPELYLHPQAQRSLFESLVNLSESDNQVIICTHSSALVDLEYYKSICIVKRESTTIGTKIQQCTSDIFTGDAKKDFNLAYWINPDRGELFFAKKVILVEGATEKTLIPPLARKINCFKHDLTIVDCGSKDNIPLYVQLLNKFNIPYTAVYDLDHQSHKKHDAIVSADKSSSLIEQSIDPIIGKTVVFGNDIEEEIGTIAGTSSKPYEALKQINRDQFIITTKFSEKLRLMYQ